MYEAQVCYYIV